MKQLLWNLQRYHPSDCDQHVALFASRRGGSTWVMEVIAANPEFRYVAQPFAAYGGNGQSGIDVYRIDYGHYLEAEDEELRRIAEYIGDLLAGRQVLRTPWKFWQPGFWHTKSRTVLKILQAKSLMPWIQSNFDLRIVYMLRHPIAQASSVIRAGWQPLCGVFLDHPTFAAKHLTTEQRRFCENIAKCGSELELHVLSWCLDNLIPLRALAEGESRWNVIAYEHCIEYPDRIVAYLADILRIEDPGRMNRQIAKASGTARITNESGQDVFGIEQLSKWKQWHTDEQVKMAFCILECLEIDVYTQESTLPNGSSNIIAHIDTAIGGQ